MQRARPPVKPRRQSGKPEWAAEEWLTARLSLRHSLLHLTQLHSDNQLCLRRHVLEHVSFEPPKHVWPQQVMQLFYLVFLGDVGKFLQEAFQIAATKTGVKSWKQRPE